jgi:hypothetical protein
VAQAEEKLHANAQVISEMQTNLQAANKQVVNMSRGYNASGRRTVKA